jgi:elongator complex protein 3
LKLNKRGHDVQKIKDAIHVMRQYWLKISIHLMPWLYGSNFEKDIQSFKDIYSDSAFQPDEIKFYPTSVIPNTELYELYKEWEYTPITTEQILSEIRETFLNIIPPYTRIKRLIRDIPATEIVAWSNITNLSQLAHESLLNEIKNSFCGKWKIDVGKFYCRLYWDYKLFKSEGEYFGNVSKLDKWECIEIIWKKPDLESFRNFVCLDTRSREVRSRTEKGQSDFLNLVLRWYESSVGQECFISFEDELGYLYWFTRLLLPSDKSVLWVEGLEKWTAIIRELHVYGELQKIWEKSGKWTQHTWLWKRLLLFAEKLSKFFGYSQFSVISWVWVREYYKNLWFELKWTYMSKKI